MSVSPGDSSNIDRAVKLQTKDLTPFAILILAAFTFTPVHGEEAVVRTDGLWRQEGYGTLLEIEAGEVHTYQITSESCVQSSTAYDRDRQLGKFATVDVDGEETRLTLRALDGNIYYFNRQEALPEACEEYEPTVDPVPNFEIFWRTFEENYPFFGVHDVDWRDTYHRFRPRVNTGPWLGKSHFTSLARIRWSDVMNAGRSLP